MRTAREQNFYAAGVLIALPLGAAAYAREGWVGVGLLAAVWVIFWVHDIWAKRGPYKRG